MPDRSTRTADGIAGSLLFVFGACALLLVALLAAIGWLDLLRGLGLLGVGPRLPDALPLRRLAGASGQPLGRVLAAFAVAGLLAGYGLGRLPRPRRSALLLLGSLGLLALASDAAYAVQESQSLATTLAARHPGLGVLVEAGLLAAAAAVPAARRRGGRFA